MIDWIVVAKLIQLASVVQVIQTLILEMQAKINSKLIHSVITKQRILQGNLKMTLKKKGGG